MTASLLIKSKCRCCSPKKWHVSCNVAECVTQQAYRPTLLWRALRQPLPSRGAAGGTGQVVYSWTRQRFRNWCSGSRVTSGNTPPRASPICENDAGHSPAEVAWHLFQGAAQL